MLARHGDENRVAGLLSKDAVSSSLRVENELGVTDPKIDPGPILHNQSPEHKDGKRSFVQYSDYIILHNKWVKRAVGMEK